MSRHNRFGLLVRWLAVVQTFLLVAALAVPLAILAADPADPADSNPSGAPARRHSGRAPSSPTADLRGGPITKSPGTGLGLSLLIRCLLRRLAPPAAT